MADGSEVTDYLTDYRCKMAAIDNIMRPQNPHKLARPAARVEGQGAPARLLISRFQVRVLGSSLEYSLQIVGKQKAPAASPELFYSSFTVVLASGGLASF